MKVKDLMTPSVSSVLSTQSLNEAARHMWELDCGCLPVFDESEHVIGVITDRDICMAAYTKGLPINEIPVNAAMSKAVYSCAEDDALEKAEEIMRRHQVRRLPVLDNNKELKGILSINDIALAYEKNSPRSKIKSDDLATTLSTISRHSHGSLIMMAS
jgi:CBS domain-containing protein